jgi:hypothetical protein
MPAQELGRAGMPVAGEYVSDLPVRFDEREQETRQAKPD